MAGRRMAACRADCIGNIVLQSRWTHYRQTARARRLDQKVEVQETEFIRGLDYIAPGDTADELVSHAG